MQNKKKFALAGLPVRLLIFMRLTVKRENLIRFYSCGVPYTFHDVTYIPKPLHIIFDDVDEYIKKYEGQKYVRLFSPDEKYEKMFDRIQF